MAAIAGITCVGKTELVNRMLDKMIHRGRDWHFILEGENSVIGAIGYKMQEQAKKHLEEGGVAQDGTGIGRFAQASILDGGIEIRRDPLGIAPLYYGWSTSGDLCFASEVKGLLEATSDIHELPPGFRFDGHNLEPYYQLAIQNPISGQPEDIAAELRVRLSQAVEKSIGDGNVGSWLSGGLDSSTLAVLARPHVDRLHTFSAGLPGAPDLEFAQMVADHIHSEHHEVIVDSNELLAALPDVIYYLESFDALLVRSSILNFLVAKLASQYVPAVFSGEGGDELFAGYDYIKRLNPKQVPAELIDITGRLHNTALQRVDRCASANGTIAYVTFLDPDVVDFALHIPAEYKLHKGIEKWVLRQAVSDLLPETVLNRPKAKFWQGAGVEDLLARYAEEHVSTNDFKQERELPNGWLLNTKEELLYYRHFKAHFGSINDLSWMGRTKGAPVA